MTISTEFDVIVRPATSQDVAAVQALIEPFVTQRMLLSRTDAEIGKLTENGFIAAIGDRVVGFSAVEIYSRKLAELQCMAVAADCHGKGIGRQLVQCCIDRAREREVYELMAITSSDEFLQSCGFGYSTPEQKRALFVHTGDRPRE